MRALFIRWEHDRDSVLRDLPECRLRHPGLDHLPHLEEERLPIQAELHLQKSTFSETQDARTRYNKVIKYAHVDQRERLFQRLRQRLVGMTWFSHT